MKVFSTISPKLVEYIGKSSWRIRWNVEKQDNLYTYDEHTFKHKPSLQEIKNIILASYNSEIDNKILSGFVWNDMQVWLSSENQFNYKTAYDLAVQTNGASLPVTFKFGSSDNPIYYKFTTLEDLTSFYTSAMTHIINMLNQGWNAKDSINWNLYLYGAGTTTDPYVYNPGIKLELGKYYSQEDKIYLCYKDSDKIVNDIDLSKCSYVSLWQ